MSLLRLLPPLDYCIQTELIVEECPSKFEKNTASRNWGTTHAILRKRIQSEGFKKIESHAQSSRHLLVGYMTGGDVLMNTFVREHSKRKFVTSIRNNINIRTFTSCIYIVSYKTNKYSLLCSRAIKQTYSWKRSTPLSCTPPRDFAKIVRDFQYFFTLHFGFAFLKWHGWLLAFWRQYSFQIVFDWHSWDKYCGKYVWLWLFEYVNSFIWKD